MRTNCKGRDEQRTLVTMVTKDYHLDSLVVNASAWREADLGSIPACAVDLFSESSHTSNKLVLQLPPFRVPGVVGSALGLVGLVSVY